MSDRRGPSASTPHSPWSSEANTPNAPIIVWETPDASPASPDDAGGDSAPLDHAAEGRGARVGRIIAMGVAAVVAAAILAWLWPDGADDGSTDTDPTAAGPATTLGTLPPLEQDSSAESSPSGGRSDDPVGGGSASVNGDTDGSSTAPPVRPLTIIELPAELRDTTSPFEVVMTTPDGIATLSSPSGSLRSTAVDLAGTNPMRVTVAPDATLVDGFARAAIVDRTGRTTDLEIETSGQSLTPVGWTVDGGATEFLVQARQPDGEPRLIGVDTTGDVRDLGPTTTSTTYLSRSGSRLVNDSGAVYRLEPNGDSSLVASGTMLGFGGNRILLRTCDEQYRCQLATLDVDTGERIDFTPDPAFDVPSQLVWANDALVSPDGTMAVITDQPPGAPYPTTVIIRSNGPSIFLAAPTGSGRLSSIGWLPDSSGFLRVFGAGFSGIGSSVEFVDADGDAITLDGLPDGVTSLGVRSVDGDGAAVAIEQIDAGAPADLEVALVGVDDGVAVHLDLRERSVTSWATPSLGAAPLLRPIGDQLFAVSADGATAFRTTLGAIQRHQRSVGPGSSALRFAGPQPDLFWRSNDDGTTFELARHPLASEGDDPIVVVEVESDDVLGTDGAGALVYRRGGDVFVTDTASTRRVTTGELLTVGPEIAFALECNDAGRCANTLIGADGARSVLGGLPALARPPERWPVPSGTASPDGTLHLLRYPDADPEWAFVDIAETQILAVPEPDDHQPVLWTGDSRFAFFLSNRVIHVFDRELDSLTALTAAGEFDAITTVPLDFRD